MADFKSKRLLFYILTLIICFLLFASLFRPNDIYNDNQLTHFITNEDTVVQPQHQQISGNSTKTRYTYDPHWKPKQYPRPPQDTITAILNNVIVEQETIKQYDAKEQKKVTKKQQLNVLLTAVVNSGMLDYTYNWIESLKRTNQDDRFLVFAIDQGVVDGLTKKGYGRQVTMIPNDWFHVPLASDFALWKSSDYRPITHAKTLVVERLLYLDITVWFSDVDIVFLSPHIRETILTQMAQRPNTDVAFSQEVDYRTVNSGFYMIKPTIVAKQFMDRVIQGQDATEVLTQQKVMNSVLKSMFPRDLLNSPYRLLDMMLFPNGNYYFRMNLPLKLGIQPLMVHANYLVGDKKKETLVKAGLWYDGQ